MQKSVTRVQESVTTVQKSVTRVQKSVTTVQKSVRTVQKSVTTVQNFVTNVSDWLTQIPTKIYIFCSFQKQIWPVPVVKDFQMSRLTQFRSFKIMPKTKTRQRALNFR